MSHTLSEPEARAELGFQGLYNLVFQGAVFLFNGCLDIGPPAGFLLPPSPFPFFPGLLLSAASQSFVDGALAARQDWISISRLSIPGQAAWRTSRAGGSSTGCPASMAVRMSGTRTR